MDSIKKMKRHKKMSLKFFNFFLQVFLISLTIPNALANSSDVDPKNIAMESSQPVMVDSQYSVNSSGSTVSQYVTVDNYSTVYSENTMSETLSLSIVTTETGSTNHPPPEASTEQDDNSTAALQTSPVTPYPTVSSESKSSSLGSTTIDYIQVAPPPIEDSDNTGTASGMSQNSSKNHVILKSGDVAYISGTTAYVSHSVTFPVSDVPTSVSDGINFSVSGVTTSSFGMSQTNYEILKIDVASVSDAATYVSHAVTSIPVSDAITSSVSNAATLLSNAVTSPLPDTAVSDMVTSVSDVITSLSGVNTYKSDRITSPVSNTVTTFLSYTNVNTADPTSTTETPENDEYKSSTTSSSIDPDSGSGSSSDSSTTGSTSSGSSTDGDTATPDPKTTECTPGPDVSLKIVNTSSTTESIEVQWELKGGCSDVTETYNIYWNSTTSNESGNDSTNETSYNITSLKPCTKYSIKVEAQGVQDKIEHDTEVADVSVMIVNVTSTAESIEVHWELEDECSDVTEYEICWNSTTSDESCYNITNEMSYNITSLKPCTGYSIKVKVKGVENATEYNTKVAVPELKQTTTDKTSATFTFGIAESCVNADCRVICSLKNNSRPNLIEHSNSSKTFTDTITEVQVEDLSPYATYSCEAYASKNGYNTSEIKKTDVNTEEDVPPPPEIKEVTEDNRSLYISWSINEDDVPGKLLNFIVTANYIGSDATTVCPDDSSCGCNTSVPPTSMAVDSQDRSCELTGLLPYSNYNVTVSASTSAGENKTSEVFTTKPEVSEEVRNPVSYLWKKEKDGNIFWETELKWQLPCNIWGKLKGFIININESNTLPKYMNYSSPDCCKYILEDKLQSNTFYSVSVAVDVDEADNSPGTATGFLYPAGTPPPSGTEHPTTDPSATSDPTQTRVTFKRGIFQDTAGEIIWYEIIVAQKGKEEKSTRGLYDNRSEIPYIESWNNVKNGEAYRATPDGWNPFKEKSSDVGTFTLGEEDCSNVKDNKYRYCNGPLNPETTYAMKIRAYTHTDKGGYQDSNIIYFTTGSEVAVGVIIGVLMGVIALGLLAVLFVMYRKGTLVWPPTFFKRSEQITVRPQPILLKKFPSYCVLLLDTPNRLKNEFQLLATLSADINAVNTTVFGEQPENRKKNRYINVLPYDATRVTLNLLDGDPTSHYINASFIKGYSDDIEYIATQGPLEDTCEDFWRMVYQHDVRIIAMVTNLVEQNKLKCHQYYPNLRENLVFGDMTIYCTTEINFPIHTARTLILMKGERKRTISHLHFREWPDFGVPQSTDFMLQFCQTMRHHAMAAELGLILVHCSAGVGRTGTLIAIDILLQHISENKKVDIFGTVFKLRKQRTNMVQTEGQYTYIYRCIKDAIEDPTIVNQGTTANNSLEPIYENVGTSLNSLQYEKLPKVSYKSSSSESECEL